MTPERQQAKDLIDEFLATGISFFEAKECAKICVNRIVLSNPHSNPLNTDGYSTMEWWLKVKREIEKA